jgi:hypothetical protein
MSPEIVLIDTTIATVRAAHVRERAQSSESMGSLMRMERRRVA